MFNQKRQGKENTLLHEFKLSQFPESKALGNGLKTAMRIRPAADPNQSTLTEE